MNMLMAMNKSQISGASVQSPGARERLCKSGHQKMLLQSAFQEGLNFLPFLFYFLSRPGEGLVSKQKDQIQKAETGRRRSRIGSKEKRIPPHQPMEDRHQAVQHGGH